MRCAPRSSRAGTSSIRRRSLLVAENTHNRAGGIVFPADALAAALAVAREAGLATYLDGARILNAAVATGSPAASLAAGFDLVSLSLSKGLGAPAGSMLAGSTEVIERAHRYRRMAGGAMRQAGILAAAGSYALANHVERLAEDHANAHLLAEELLRGDDVELDLATVQTNIVVFSLVERRGVPDAAAFVDECRARGVLAQRLRAEEGARGDAPRDLGGPGPRGRDGDASRRRRPLDLLHRLDGRVGIELQRRGVDAVAQPRRLVAGIVEDVAEVAAAPGAVHLGARHEERSIRLGLDRIGLLRLVERGPAGP